MIIIGTTRAERDPKTKVRSMFIKKKERFADLGEIKRPTNEIVTAALERQRNSGLHRGSYSHLVPARKRLIAAKSVGPAGSAKVKNMNEKSPYAKTMANDPGDRSRGICAYWFPIVCAMVIVLLCVWAFVPARNARTADAATPGVPEPTTNTVVVNERILPTFDIVRIERGGKIIIAGHYLPHKTVSVMVGKKIIATEMTDDNGDFVYAPTKNFQEGNYVLHLVAVDTNDASENRVFLYVAKDGAENSLSLLMTADGSTLLQAPRLADGDLVVQKIDYLVNGRMVVTGVALPRLRVSLALDGHTLGFARVSDHKNFGLGADVGKLNPGQRYEMSVRLHDGDGRTVAEITHRFAMPEMTGEDDTFYVVRRGDALWIIARNFLGRGTLFTMIAKKNDIKNPNLIFPKQKLQIPVKKK